MTRKDPNLAKQKFCATDLTGGCHRVEFYNHGNLVYTEDEIAQMIYVAKKYFNPVSPVMVDRAGQKRQLELFVWVDIEENAAWIGKAFTADQTAIGSDRTVCRKGPNASTTCKWIRRYATFGWRFGLVGFA